MNNQLDNYELALGFLQVFDVLLNVSQVSNDELLKELQRQDSEYLEVLKNKVDSSIVQNDKIFDILKYIIENQKMIINQNRAILEKEDEILQRLMGD